MNPKNHYSEILNSIKKEGLYKLEATITSPQGVNITINQDKEVLNFCANNYLGLSNHPEIINAAKEAMEKYGFGMA